jgi:molybdopterin/thiamine biosynthesis adenylyltransferase
MFVEIKDRLKLRPSVAVVIKDNITEFFLSDIRKSYRIQCQSTVAKLLFELNGSITLRDWLSMKKLNDEEISDFLVLLNYLNSINVLIKVDKVYGVDFKRYPRVFSFLENFYHSQSEVNVAFEKIKNSTVMIIGLGSVGTWASQSLLMSGVENFIFVDNDNVEISNLHRQCGFKESDVGTQKTIAFANRLKGMNNDIHVTCINDWLDSGFFDRHTFDHIDLIVNCADYPSVDETSLIVGDYSMKNGIPHIIGGGYNLHLSLVGQVVIPGKTACMECFRKNLEELNEIDTSNIWKLENKNRKVGSFPPLSALSASITANEAFKVLAGLDNFVMTNQRTEFHIDNLNFTNILMKRREDCKWCGYEGMYYKLQRNQNK